MTRQEIFSKIRQYPLPVAAITVILVGGIYWLLRGSGLVEAEDDLAELERQWKQVEDNITKSIGLEENRDRAKELLEALEGRLLNPATVAANYGYFYQLEKDWGVRMMQLSQQNPVEKRTFAESVQDYELIPYNVAIEGSFYQVLGAVQALENGHYLTRIESWALSGGEGGTGGAAARSTQVAPLTARLELNILARKEESSAK